MEDMWDMETCETWKHVRHGDMWDMATWGYGEHVGHGGHV